MIPLKVQMVVFSHLSDIQEIAGRKDVESVIIDKVNFCKYLLGKFKDTTIEIDSDEEYTEYQRLQTEPRYNVLRWGDDEFIIKLNFEQRNKALEAGLILFAGKGRLLVMEENIDKLLKLVK